MPASPPDRLTALVSERAGRQVDVAITAIADSVRERVGDPVRAILAYGSCLRGVSVEESLVDLYVLVSDYGQLRESAMLRRLNALVPPNVYYHEFPDGARTLRAKYAVVSLDQFEQRVSPKTRNPYFWARFAQPSAIVYAADDTARARIVDALRTAVSTFLAESRLLAGPGADAAATWVAGLTATYGTELRSEGPARARDIYEAERAYCDAVAEAAPPSAPGGGSWAMRRLVGKALSVARLMKAAFTFAGGADYLSWKIERHSGVRVELTPWQRRHPILASVVLFPKLYASGGFR